MRPVIGPDGQEELDENGEVVMEPVPGSGGGA